MDLMFILKIKSYIYLLLLIPFLAFISWSQGAPKKMQKKKIEIKHKYDAGKARQHRFIP